MTNAFGLPRFIIEREDGSWVGSDHPNGPWHSISAPQQALPWPTDGPAVLKSREPASVAPEATGTRPLSPAAQAVLDAAVLPCTIREGIAAALRALADQDETLFDGDEELMPAVRAVRTDRILAIAAELEVSHD